MLAYWLTSGFTSTYRMLAPFVNSKYLLAGTLHYTLYGSGMQHVELIPSVIPSRSAVSDLWKPTILGWYDCIGSPYSPYNRTWCSSLTSMNCTGHCIVTWNKVPLAVTSLLAVSKLVSEGSNTANETYLAAESSSWHTDCRHKGWSSGAWSSTILLKEHDNLRLSYG